MKKIESKKLTSTKSSNKIIQFTCEGYLLAILEEKKPYLLAFVYPNNDKIYFIAVETYI